MCVCACGRSITKDFFMNSFINCVLLTFNFLFVLPFHVCVVFVDIRVCLMFVSVYYFVVYS